MTYLKYIGKTIDEVGVVPLPEGWPAATHEDKDAQRVKEKLASGFYERASAAEAKEEGEVETLPPAPEPSGEKE